MRFCKYMFRVQTFILIRKQFFFSWKDLCKSVYTSMYSSIVAQQLGEAEGSILIMLQLLTLYRNSSCKVNDEAHKSEKTSSTRTGRAEATRYGYLTVQK